MSSPVSVVTVQGTFKVENGVTTGTLSGNGAYASQAANPSSSGNRKVISLGEANGAVFSFSGKGGSGKQFLVRFWMLNPSQNTVPVNGVQGFHEADLKVTLGPTQITTPTTDIFYNYFMADTIEVTADATLSPLGARVSSDTTGSTATVTFDNLGGQTIVVEVELLTGCTEARISWKPLA